MAISKRLVFMSFKTRTIKKWLSFSVAIGLFSALLATLMMTSDALKNSARFDSLYTLLLVINAIALVALSILILLNISQLLSQVRKGRAGSRLTFRLLSLLVILSALPVTVVYYFSLGFLHQRLDSWLDIKMETALTNAMELGRYALDVQMRNALEETEDMAKKIQMVSDEAIPFYLSEVREQSDAYELTLFTSTGKIINSNSIEIGNLLPNLPHDNVFLQLKQSGNYISLEPLESGLHIRIIVKFNNGIDIRLLQALYSIESKVNDLAKYIETTFEEYKERSYLHQPLKWSFTLVLSLVLMLTLASTMWIAFFSARRFVAPLTQLVEGTKAVGEGTYTQLPVKQFDELGFLVNSFNDMTSKIAQARNEAHKSQQLAESQRTYLETVLSRLSSGVISLDAQQRLRTANPAAEQILGLPLCESRGEMLMELQQDYPTLEFMCNAIHGHVLNNDIDWREEVTVFGSKGRKILMCRGTQLQTIENKDNGLGQVIVFDDVTALVQAQRDAAWSEVARRLAHEIKNPLTPIQLSTERLRHKYLPKLSSEEGNLLDRMTHTIIQQVDSLKSMVDDFSDYAKTSTIQWQQLDLNVLIKLCKI